MTFPQKCSTCLVRKAEHPFMKVWGWNKCQSSLASPLAHRNAEIQRAEMHKILPDARFSSFLEVGVDHSAPLHPSLLYFHLCVLDTDYTWSSLNRVIIVIIVGERASLSSQQHTATWSKILHSPFQCEILFVSFIPRLAADGWHSSHVVKRSSEPQKTRATEQSSRCWKSCCWPYLPRLSTAGPLPAADMDGFTGVTGLFCHCGFGCTAAECWIFCFLLGEIKGNGS